MHHQGHIPKSALKHWKGMLVALNQAFDPDGMDFLLFLRKMQDRMKFSSDGVLRLARLIAADLVEVPDVRLDVGSTVATVVLTRRGNALVDAWLAGDEKAYKDAVSHRL